MSQDKLERALSHRRTQRKEVVHWLDTHTGYTMQVNIMCGCEHVCVGVNKNESVNLANALLTALDKQIVDIESRIKDGKD